MSEETNNSTLTDKVFNLLGLSDWVTKSKAMQYSLYIAFLVLIGIFHIYNSHIAEGMVRDINKAEKEIKELRWEYTSVKSDLMLKSKQSVLEDQLIPIGISTTKEPSKKIVVKSNEYKD
jgi:hypothetical protein